jgi:hypothetical protein
MVLEGFHGAGILLQLLRFHKIMQVFDRDQSAVFFEYPCIECLITFGHLTKSWCHLFQSLLLGIPFAPAVGGAAGDRKIVLHPPTESAILIMNVITAALRSKPLA